MKRRRKILQAISLLVMIVLVSCQKHQVKKQEIDYCLKRSFFTMNSEDSTKVAGHGYLFFECKINNREKDTIIWRGLEFDPSVSSKGLDFAYCRLINGDSIKLFAESRVDRGVLILPEDTFRVLLSLDLYVGQHLPDLYNKFDSISRLVKDIACYSPDSILEFVFSKSSIYTMDGIDSEYYIEGEGLKCDIDFGDRF